MQAFFNCIHFNIIYDRREIIAIALSFHSWGAWS